MDSKILFEFQDPVFEGFNPMADREITIKLYKKSLHHACFPNSKDLAIYNSPNDFINFQLSFFDELNPNNDM